MRPWHMLCCFLASLVLFVAAAGPLAAGEPIKIGVIAPLSGSLAPYGKGCLDGMELRIDACNAAGGVKGRPLELVVEDNRGDKTESRNIYKKLVGTDKVVAVMGPVTSTNTLALKMDARKLAVPVISPTATNDRVTRGNDYLFRSCFKDSFQGQVIARYACKTLGIEKAAVMVDQNSDYSRGLSRSFTRAVEELGGRVVANEGYRQKDTEFGPQLNKIKQQGAELIFVPGYPPEVPLIVKQAKVVGFAGKLCGADGWDNQAVLTGSGENLAGCFITGMFSAEDERPLVQTFLKAATAKLGARPGTFQAQGYDTASMVIAALATGATPEAIKDGLLAIKDLEAVTGSITVTPDGDAIKSAVILEIEREGERYVPKYRATIAP